jgi:hypothetical protein
MRIFGQVLLVEKQNASYLLYVKQHPKDFCTKVMQTGFS